MLWTNGSWENLHDEWNLSSLRRSGDNPAGIGTSVLGGGETDQIQYNREVRQCILLKRKELSVQHK